MSGWRGVDSASLKSLWSPGVIDPEEKDPPTHIYNGPTKSELVHDADIRQAVHQEGSWYIIPVKYCYFYFGTTPFASHVFHVCTKSWLLKSNPDERGVEKPSVSPYTCHRIWQADMSIACNYCGETPPEGLVGLWSLHNFDSLCENDHTA